MDKKLRDDFLKIYVEIEFNATEDTIFERMTLKRLQDFAAEHFGVDISLLLNDECKEANTYLQTHTEAEWRREIRKRRIALWFNKSKEMSKQ